MPKLILTLLCVLAPASAQDTLDADVHRIAAAFHGDVAIAARVVNADGPAHSYALNGDRRVKTASTIKVPVMLDVIDNTKVAHPAAAQPTATEPCGQ